MKQSLDGSLPNMCPVVRPSDQDGCTAELSSTQDPMGNSHKNHLFWNQQLNQNQTLMEQSLDGPFPKLCPAVVLSHQDGCHSAVALLLKTALIQVSDYRLLASSGCILLLFCLPFERRETYCFSLIFLPLLLLLSEACPDHNLFVFRDRSMIFGMWVHGHKAVCRVP